LRRAARRQASLDPEWSQCEPSLPGVWAFAPGAAGRVAVSLRLLLGAKSSRLVAAGFAAEPTSLLALPPEDVRRVVATAAGLGDLLLRTMVTRREWLQGRGLGQQRLIGSRRSGEAFAVRELLERNLAPFTWHDLATDGKAARRAIGLVPQELAIYEDLTPRQNLMYFGELYGARDTALVAAVDTALGIAELQDVSRQRP